MIGSLLPPSYRYPNPYKYRFTYNHLKSAFRSCPCKLQKQRALPEKNIIKINFKYKEILPVENKIKAMRFIIE